MGRIRNRIVNTLGIAPRTVKTAGRTTIDTTKSALNLALDPFIGLGKTGSDIKQAIHRSFTEGRWYQKLRKVPASLALSPFMAVEGVAETLRGTGVNACSSVRDIIGNTLTNEGTAIKMMGKGEKFDFSTEKLEYKDVSPRNRLAGLFKPKTEIDVERDILKDKKKDLKEQEKKIKELREKENARIESEKEQVKKDRESLKKQREEWRDSKKAEQEKRNERVKQEREGFNKEKEELNKRIAILEQEKKELQATLKNSENSEKKADTTKPKVKKESNSENKEITAKKTDSKPEKKETGENSDGNPEIKEAA